MPVVNTDQSKYDRLALIHANRLFRALTDWLGGRITLEKFQLEFQEIVFNGHEQSYRSGNIFGGGRGDGFDAFMAGIVEGDSDRFFISRFLSDIRNETSNLYDDDGNLKIRKTQNRMKLYVGRMRGTANQGFMDASGPDIEFWWVLVAENHCVDCPILAANSPYTKDANLGYPGDGTQQCLGNCKCYLRREDGVVGFRRPLILGGYD
jgi:hypothetical protein